MGPCAYVLLLTLFLSIWQLRVTGRLSVTALAVFAMLGVLSLVYGRMVTRLAFQAPYDARNLTMQFLTGYLLLNTLLWRYCRSCFPSPWRPVRSSWPVAASSDFFAPRSRSDPREF